jgi:hypothetical protein
MRNNEEIKELLAYFPNTEDKPLVFDEAAIIAAYRESDDNKQSISIKILSVFGGILASFTFLGFLFITGLYNSDIGLLLFGAILIVVSIGLNKAFNNIILDTISVSFFVIGFILIGLGLGQFYVSENKVSIIFIVMAFISLIIVQNYILAFLSVLIINGCILMLIMSNNAYNFIGLYISVVSLVMVYFFLKEAQIITIGRAFSRLYEPVRIGLIFSLLSGLAFVCKRGLISVSANSLGLSSVLIMSSIVYLIYLLLDVFKITETRYKIGICALTILMLLPTALSPAISGSMLIMLLSFWVNYKTGLALGIFSFIYFISQYYYDLNFTLLTKSMLLFSSGVLFLALYLFTYKKLTPDEKI